ncbi:MAG: CcdB family protein [Rubrivivax sp.]|nr:CcdB family protein [Rubrivivax sp.]
MRQFEAFANPNVAQRPAFPYVVVMQSEQLQHHSTRLVMPLARLPRAPELAPRRLSVAVTVAGEPLYPAAHLCGALPARLLRHSAGLLREQSHLLVDALDAVISGI